MLPGQPKSNCLSRPRVADLRVDPLCCPPLTRPGHGHELNMARIELINLRKTLKERQRGRDSVFSIHDLNLTIPDGKTVVVLGPSGCGKTTLLKIIAGLIPPDSGEVRCNGLSMNDVPPGERRVGMVFQSYAL